MDRQERTDALSALVNASLKMSELSKIVAGLPWDSDKPLVSLTRPILVQVLKRYLAGQLSAADLHLWAELVEMREDIDVGRDERVTAAIFRIANPQLEGEVTESDARHLVGSLEDDSAPC